MMNGIQFQNVQAQGTLSNELRSVIRDNVLQFYMQDSGTGAQEEGITALYERLSQEDKLDGESNSIANQDEICQGVFLPKYIKSCNAGAMTLPHCFFNIG